MQCQLISENMARDSARFSRKIPAEFEPFPEAFAQCAALESIHHGMAYLTAMISGSKGNSAVDSGGHRRILFDH